MTFLPHSPQCQMSRSPSIFAREEKKRVVCYTGSAGESKSVLRSSLTVLRLQAARMIDGVQQGPHTSCPRFQ